MASTFLSVLTVKRCLAENYSLENLPKKLQFYKEFLEVTKKLDVGYPIVSNFCTHFTSILINFFLVAWTSFI